MTWLRKARCLAKWATRATRHNKSWWLLVIETRQIVRWWWQEAVVAQAGKGHHDAYCVLFHRVLTPNGSSMIIIVQLHMKFEDRAKIRLVRYCKTRQDAKCVFRTCDWWYPMASNTPANAAVSTPSSCFPHISLTLSTLQTQHQLSIC
jgi:hypothetical protein